MDSSDFRDQFGYLVDESADGGDSAHFAGLAALFGMGETKNLLDYEVAPGILVRHPIQSPWNNPKNYTIDQLAPFVAGCKIAGYTKLVRRVFWAHVKRFFFAQNFERDKPGSKKYLWPHEFYKDSNPDTTTRVRGFNPRLNSRKARIESRILDFADPMGLSDVWHLILCAEMKWLYWFGLIGYPALAISVFFAGLSRSNDTGRILAKAKIGGRFFIWLFKKTKTGWKDSLESSWVRDRHMPNLANAIVTGL